jgi:hypothetical protein
MRSEGGELTGRVRGQFAISPQMRQSRRSPAIDGKPHEFSQRRFPSMTQCSQASRSSSGQRARPTVWSGGCGCLPRRHGNDDVQPRPVGHHGVTNGVLMSIRRPDVRSIRSTRSASSPAPRIVVVSSLRPRRTTNTRPGSLVQNCPRGAEGAGRGATGHLSADMPLTVIGCCGWVTNRVCGLVTD